MWNKIAKWFLKDRNAPYYMEQGHRRYYTQPIPFHYKLRGDHESK